MFVLRDDKFKEMLLHEGIKLNTGFESFLGLFASVFQFHRYFDKSLNETILQVFLDG